MVKNRFLFVAMLFAALSFGFVSCDDKKGNEPDDPATEQGGSTENNGNEGEETFESENSITGTENGHAYVDLGLPSGLKWATCNVGATRPGESGDYFAWGETIPKKINYNWNTYKWCTALLEFDEFGHEYYSVEYITKYCTDSTLGTVDNKTVLDKEDDAAAVHMGGSWRMPTIEELKELINECTWTCTTEMGVTFLDVEGPNGNSIFFPSAGYRGEYEDYDYSGLKGAYLSSSLYTGYSDNAYGLGFNSDKLYISCSSRCIGFSVRGVIE